MSKRIGIFGGTFDPVHSGHLHAAKQIVSELNLEQLNLVPAFKPVHRDVPSANSAQRLEMLSLATVGEDTLLVDSREVSREGPSYSILTLKEYRAEHPDAMLYFIVGTDAINQFDRWYEWQSFLEYTNLVILPRPGFKLDLHPKVAQAFETRWQTNLDDFKSAQSGQIYQSQQAMLTQSATDFRNSLASEQHARTMLHPSVYEYIREHKLYGKDLVE